MYLNSLGLPGSESASLAALQAHLCQMATCCDGTFFQACADLKTLAILLSLHHMDHCIDPNNHRLLL